MKSIFAILLALSFSAVCSAQSAEEVKEMFSDRSKQIEKENFEREMLKMYKKKVEYWYGSEVADDLSELIFETASNEYGDTWSEVTYVVGPNYICKTGGITILGGVRVYSSIQECIKK